jgi:hypothetical protein
MMFGVYFILFYYFILFPLFYLFESASIYSSSLFAAFLTLLGSHTRLQKCLSFAEPVRVLFVWGTWRPIFPFQGYMAL